MKRQHTITGGAGALGKNGDTVPRAECIAHHAQHAIGGPAAAAFDKESAIEATQPADQGPSGDIVLADEAGREDGIDDKDVDEGNMVANQQSVGRCRSLKLDPNAKQAQELMLPDALEALTPGWCGPGEDQRDLDGSG
jgi:hypothetical protein